MNGKERILTALEVREPDCVPLYIHGINEAPIIGIGLHLTDNLPEPRDFRLMNDRDKLKLVDTLFMIIREMPWQKRILSYLIRKSIMQKFPFIQQQRCTQWPGMYLYIYGCCF